MEKLLRAALEELARGRKAVLCTVVDAQGSTPRGRGAAMVVGETGLLAGTVGGGELEYRCIQMAPAPEKPLMEFSLDNTQAAALGMVCGGRARVLFTDLEDAALLEAALERLRNLRDAWLELPLDGDSPTLADAGAAEPECREGLLRLPLAQSGRIFLFGGGHVALALSKVLDILGYPYLVLDDREEFSAPSRFPGARMALTVDFACLSRVLTGDLTPGSRDCICIMTRGHLADTQVLRFALTTGACYIGLMGSRKKRERVFAQLEAEGFADAPRRITTPIGLPIGGQTPAEVAISVAAQLVALRNRIP